MNQLSQVTIIGCILSFFGLSMSSAQDYRYRAPSSQSMIQSLRGGGHHSHTHSHSRSVTKRSIEISPNVCPKGCSARLSGGTCLAYNVDAGCQLCTSQIQFRKNSIELADVQSYNYLQNLAIALQSAELRHQRFVIEGHASAEGSYSTNLTLSQRRANAIFDFLVSRGVCSSRLMSVGHGESRAQYSSSSPEYLRAKDRKVIIFKMAG